MDVRIQEWGPSSTSRQWFVTLRLVEVAALALLVGTCIQLWFSWSVTADFDPFGDGEATTPDIPFMSRVTSLVFFNDQRLTFVSLVVVAAVVALGVAVLLHRGPVANARLVRWELLALWSGAMVVALVVVAFHVIALFGQDPYATQPDGTTITDPQGFRPNMLVQLLAGVSWPAAGALFLVASGLWWLRLPSDLEEDEEDEEEEGNEGNEAVEGNEALEDRDAAGEREDDETRAGAADRDRPPGDRAGRNGAGPDPRRPRHPVGSRPRPGQRSRARSRRRDEDRDDVLVLDGVEQIEPVERLTPRHSGSDDGGTSSGYDDYFRRV